MKILVVEDEPSLRDLMQAALKKERYVVEVAGNYQTALEKIELYDYDCILLDIMLPDGNGLTLLEKLKERQKRASVIIISAKDSLDDKVRGLELGADDYLPKPFHLAELQARIKSIIRRNNNQGNMLIEFGNIKINPSAFEVIIAGKHVELGKKEYDILSYFIYRANHIISKDVLAEAVWGDDIDQVDNFDFIYAQIKNIRKKMKEYGADSEIKSVYGFGYKLSLN
ncbi:MAG: response regulator transcription factor [Bacteroidales bacterium]|nr:response regulator transcription factor [Bacteroidales bacterium]